MLDRLNLNDIAEAYLSVGLPDQLEYERLLIRSRGDAIFPLLRAILIMIAKRKHLVDARVEQARNLPIGEGGIREQWAGGVMESMLQDAHDVIRRLVAEDEVREQWARGVIEPMLQDAHDVIRRLGPLTQGVLCGMLLHDEYKIRLVAAFLLAMNNSPDKKIQQLVQLTIDLLQRNYKNQEILVKVLEIVLLHIGVSEWKKIVEDEAHSMNVTVEEWIEQMRITALIELSK